MSTEDVLITTLNDVAEQALREARSHHRDAAPRANISLCRRLREARSHQPTLRIDRLTVGGTQM